MNRADSNRLILCSCLVAAMLAACDESQSAIATSPTVPRSQTSGGYRTLYSFGKLFSGGREPKAALVDKNGRLYGTTYGGGSTACIDGCGVVFMITTLGKEKVLYRFGGGNDGANPSASLIVVGGLLYGTTEYGGEANEGTVFEVSTAGAEKVLHSFGYGSSGRYYNDGANPVASLVEMKGVLYGTTANGGSDGAGTVFSISLNGKENVLHSFGQGDDGANPVANLIDMKGSLYGTTEHTGRGGYGSIFKISATGTEKTLYRFSYGPNGGYPEAGLINVKDTLYGTTAYGGDDQAGTAFSITTGGILTVLYSFGGTSGQGIYPEAPLLSVGDEFVGTTSSGVRLQQGNGAIFSMTSNGEVRVIHTFGIGFDGAAPLAGVINVKNMQYGTTSAGGTYGEGTVFASPLTTL